jgi:hypothetical protein
MLYLLNRDSLSLVTTGAFPRLNIDNFYIGLLSIRKERRKRRAYDTGEKNQRKVKKKEYLYPLG